MPYRFLNPAPLFFNIPGTAPASGGSLSFYEISTTDPKDTWSDEDLTIPNSNPVLIDASGRANTNIWLDGDYTVVLRDGDGVTVWTRDVTSGFAAGTTIPALVADYFLTNDGTNLSWQPILQLPDPTGSDGYMLTTDGANFLWTPVPEIPEVPDPEIVVGTLSFRGGVSDDTNKFLIQAGNDSAPSSPSGKTTSKNVLFATTYTAAPVVTITPVGSTFTNAGYMTDFGVTSVTTTGFTATFNTNHGEANADGNINVPIPFGWIAVGNKTVA